MFLFLKRNGIILILVLAIALIGGFYVNGKKQASFHTTIFTTIANESASGSQENEQASTYFGETLMGWFRNPAFLEKIYTEAGTTGNLSAHKQERQNLIIEIDADQEENNLKLAKATFNVLETEITSFNQKTQNKFTILNLGTTTSQNPLQNTLFFLAILLSAFFFSLASIIVWEASRGMISLPAQIEFIFGKNHLVQFKQQETEDIEYLATLCLNATKPIVFAGADFDQSDITVKIALKASEIEKKLVLVDGDLKVKKLQQNLGLSEMLKNLKGLTDRVQKEEKLSKFVHKALAGNLNFLSAGNGATAILEDLAEQLEEHKTVIIHTLLPQNFPILTLKEFELFLFVKLGKTKLKTLEQIKALNIKNLKIFLV